MQYPDAAICKIHFLFYNEHSISQSTFTIDAGYVLTGLALIQVPMWGFYEMFQVPESGILQKLKGVFRPNNDWGPKNSKQRLEWVQFTVQNEMNQVLD